jgi:hypothetical protein
MKHLLLFFFSLAIVAKPSSCNKKAAPKNGDGFYRLEAKMNLKGFSKDCKQFIKSEVRTKWKLHESGECYLNDQPFWESVLGHQECFMLKSRAQIQSIFGMPSRTHRSKSQKALYEIYNMGDSCSSNYSYFNLQFIYNDNDSLISIGQGQTTFN